MTSAFRSGLFRRALPLILLVAGIPVILLGALSYVGINGLHFDGFTLNPRQVAAEEADPKVILDFEILGIKDLAVEESHRTLADRSLTSLELRAVDLSKRVAGFLAERERDLRALAAMPPSVQTYVDFSRANHGQVWTRDGTFDLPFYKEIAFVDTMGQEEIRILDESPVPDSQLRDVSRPENTTYKTETYFAECIDLERGEVHVQRMLGWYVPVSEAYAHGENPDGRRYEGVMRFCTPIFQGGQKQGLLVLSLDWTHVMELIAHVVGSDEGYVDEIGLDPESGKLADIHSYLVSDEGWALYHAKAHAIKGLDAEGVLVPSINAEDFAEQQETGLMPVNANEMAFLGNKVYPYPWPLIDDAIHQGEASGYVRRYGSATGVPKAMAWARVPYYTPPFNTPAGFGWVGISIDAQTFSEAPNALGALINRQATTWSVWLYAIMGVVTLYAAATVGYVIYRRVSEPVGHMLGIAQRIAAGDLAPFEADLDRDDELAQLQASLAQMLENLRAVITHIRGAALHLSSAAEEVKATLNEQAGVANDSASAVTETTSTMEELAIIAAQIAERSGSVVDDAAQAQGDAQAGARAVEDVVAKLDEIRAANESNVKEIIALGRRTRRISEVMDLIDRIAARTKLIAFNASLEAAAAGESGRRFGVVAMEVRRLADNVVESTEEIQERVEEIQAAANALALASEQEAKRIGEGVARGEEASHALRQIVESSESTTTAAEQISLSTQQQRTAAEQVVDAVRSIQDGSQSVASGSQEASRVITDLVHLADELQRTVEQFELGNDLEDKNVAE